MSPIKFAALLIAACFTLPAFSQGVSINSTGAVADSSAMLDVSSNSKGLLIPRMTTTERNNINNPALGLQIFNTNTNCFNMWDGAAWKQSCYDCDFGTPSVSNNGPVCEGDTLMLSVGTVAGATYAWSGPNGFSSSQQNPIITNATPGASGVYSVVITASGCSSSPLTTQATVNAAPVGPSANNNGPACSGGSIQLTAATIAGASYSWTGPNGFSSSLQNPQLTNITPSNAGVYSVTATVNGCSSAASNTTVIVNLSPNPGFSYTPISPSTGASVSFSPTTVGASSYAWTFASGSPTSSSSSSPSVTWSAAGTYAVQLIVTNNGCSDTSTQNVTVTPPCSVPTNANSMAGPVAMYNFCWYLSAPGIACDLTCSSLGGSNLANSAASAFPDLPASPTGQVIHWFYQNGNPDNWTSYSTGTSYKTLGYGYTNSTYYAKNAAGTNSSAGAFPGNPNNNGTRTLACPCFTY